MAKEYPSSAEQQSFWENPFKGTARWAKKVVIPLALVGVGGALVIAAL